MTELHRELSKDEQEATFLPPMVDLTESANEIVDPWTYPVRYSG